jgi:hypothetical protein
MGKRAVRPHESGQPVTIKRAGPCASNPLIVVRREVKQSSLGKLVCILRKAATTFGIRLQEIRIHGNPPPNGIARGIRVGGCRPWLKSDQVPRSKRLWGAGPYATSHNPDTSRADDHEDAQRQYCGTYQYANDQLAQWEQKPGSQTKQRI